MSVTAPEWLERHGGGLVQSSLGHSWIISVAGKPQYVLALVPAAGKHGYQLVQTINGRHLETGNSYPTSDEAVRGGLEDLRKSLGW